MRRRHLARVCWLLCAWGSLTLWPRNALSTAPVAGPVSAGASRQVEIGSSAAAEGVAALGPLERSAVAQRADVRSSTPSEGVLRQENKRADGSSQRADLSPSDSSGRPPATRPGEISGLLEQALESYQGALESGERDERLLGFRRAQRLFAAAVGSGVENAELYTNLGNAALQAEELGAAVLAFRRALLLEPGLERARQNLQHARSLLPSWVPTPSQGGVLDTFFHWHQTMSRGDRSDLAAGLFALAALCLAASIYFRSQPFRYGAWLAVAAWLALVLSVSFDPARDAASEGVVIAREALARAADSVNAPSRFGEPLPAGTEVKILEDRGGWLQIALYNGRNAWVSASSVERIRPLH